MFPCVLQAIAATVALLQDADSAVRQQAASTLSLQASRSIFNRFRIAAQPGVTLALVSIWCYCYNGCICYITTTIARPLINWRLLKITLLLCFAFILQNSLSVVLLFAAGAAAA
jgi:hypothetical protein